MSPAHITPYPHPIGMYLSASTLDHLLVLEESLNCLPVRYSIIAGDLNTDYGWLQNIINQQVKEFLASFGLVDLLSNFR